MCVTLICFGLPSGIFRKGSSHLFTCCVSSQGYANNPKVDLTYSN